MISDASPATRSISIPRNSSWSGFGSRNGSSLIEPVGSPTVPEKPNHLEPTYQQARIKRLQTAGRTVIAHREEWKARAQGAENKAMELPVQLSRRSPSNNDRFDTLRRLVAKELHPDFCSGGAVEKTLRAEFFKELWPEIERLAEQGK
jgi:hypothetical protein